MHDFPPELLTRVLAHSRISASVISFPCEWYLKFFRSWIMLHRINCHKYAEKCQFRTWLNTLLHKNKWKDTPRKNKVLANNLESRNCSTATTYLISTSYFLAQYHFQQHWPRKTLVAFRSLLLDYNFQLSWMASWWVVCWQSSNWQFLVRSCLMFPKVST